MGYKKGQVEYNKWQKGKVLTRKEAILANCYVCNGMEDSDCDCMGVGCPLYGFMPYKLNP